MRRTTFLKISHFPEISKTISTPSSIQLFFTRTFFSMTVPDAPKVLFFLGCVAQAERLSELSERCLYVNSLIDPYQRAQYRGVFVDHHLDKQAFLKFLQQHPKQAEICSKSGLTIGHDDTVFIGLPKSVTKQIEFDGNLWVHKISNAIRSDREKEITVGAFPFVFA